VSAPSVSAIIVAFNAAAHMRDALRSIREQTRPVDEVLVVDDGSTDNTGAIAAAAGARVIRQANAGSAAARNVAIRAARGAFLAMLDADDVWLPDKTALQAAALLASPGADLCLGRVRITNELGEALRVRGAPSGEKLSFACSAAMWRREAFERFGGFDPQDAVDDLGWYARASAAGCFPATVDTLVTIKRIRDASQTRDPAVAAGMLLRLARERAANRDAAHG